MLLGSFLPCWSKLECAFWTVLIFPWQFVRAKIILTLTAVRAYQVSTQGLIYPRAIHQPPVAEGTTTQGNSGFEVRYSFVSCLSAIQIIAMRSICWSSKVHGGIWCVFCERVARMSRSEVEYCRFICLRRQPLLSPRFLQPRGLLVVITCIFQAVARPVDLRSTRYLESTLTSYVICGLLTNGKLLEPFNHDCFFTAAQRRRTFFCSIVHGGCTSE